jgi:hypothetical protein
MQRKSFNNKTTKPDHLVEICRYHCSDSDVKIRRNMAGAMKANLVQKVHYRKNGITPVFRVHVRARKSRDPAAKAPSEVL